MLRYISPNDIFKTLKSELNYELNLKINYHTYIFVNHKNFSIDFYHPNPLETDALYEFLFKNRRREKQMFLPSMGMVLVSLIYCQNIRSSCKHICTYCTLYV